MSTRLSPVLQGRWIGYVVGLTGVGLMSGTIGLLLSHLRIDNLSMLYLIVVLVAAARFGRGPAILVAIASFLAFDWFFVAPQHTLTVTHPSEWIALLLFLLTAGITGQLTAGQRLRRQEAELREREAVVLYDVTRLMSDLDLDRALHGVAERLHKEFQLAAVSIELQLDSNVTARAAVGENEALRLLQRRPLGTVHMLGQEPPPFNGRTLPGHWTKVVLPNPLGTRTPPAHQIHVVSVTAKGRHAGDMFLVRRTSSPGFTAPDDRLLSAVATQLRLAVERIRLQREVTDAEILRRSDELKTALLNAVSHDLKTPLASIIAWAGSLRRPDSTWIEEERQELGKSIEEEAFRLNQIVAHLLDLSRIEAGNLRPQKRWYDLGALVDDVLARLRSRTGQHCILVDLPDEVPPILIDYVEIDQVLSNLIENAVRHTQPGTEIRVSVQLVDQELRVEVADRGPGIPPAGLPHLFEPFYQMAGLAERSKGTGLGLAVARGLVEAHGGRIWAENQPGGGTRFIFTLPFIEPEQAKSEHRKKKS